MKLIKRWQLNKTTFDESDMLWLRKYSRAVDVNNNIREFDSASGSFQFQGQREVYVQTDTQEQEGMLQLKYGNLLFLLTQTWIAPGQIIRDQHGIITFD